MIVLDESIYDERLVESISRWYSGAVISVLTLRPATLIKDEAIPMLLQRGTQPTFLTINVTDFWQVMPPNGGYCITAVPLTQGDSLLAGDWLRRCLRMPEFSSKANRMGKVILLRPSYVEYYGRDRKIFRLDWRIQLGDLVLRQDGVLDMIAKTRPLAEVSAEEIRLLYKEPGLVDTIRFLQQFTNGFGNYTEERDGLFGNLTVEDLAQQIMERRQRLSNKSAKP